MQLTASQKESFSQLVLPLIVWLEKNTHPHCIIQVDSQHAEIIEGVCSVVGVDKEHVDLRVTRFDSANVAEICFYKATATKPFTAMGVTYANGKHYQFFDVPEELFLEARNTPSIGAFLNRHIKGAYRYAYVHG